MSFGKAHASKQISNSDSELSKLLMDNISVGSCTDYNLGQNIWEKL